jgi:hypothetical protein
MNDPLWSVVGDRDPAIRKTAIDTLIALKFPMGQATGYVDSAANTTVLEIVTNALANHQADISGRERKPQNVWNPQVEVPKNRPNHLDKSGRNVSSPKSRIN